MFPVFDERGRLVDELSAAERAQLEARLRWRELEAPVAAAPASAADGSGPDRELPAAR